ncbi:MAG: DUF2877 domain-containing protein [Anaerolineaceae bacterium]|nr:DUF2877 domain-containing protein [Anaerolineaceae bacterium]
MRRYAILQAGSFTRAPLAAHRAARVQGSTSKGIFLLFPDRKVVFLSYQPFAGPLNLILAEKYSRKLSVRVGETAQITEAEICLPESGLCFDLSAARTWQAPPPPPLSSDWRKTLETLARQAFVARPAGGWTPLLPHLMGWSEPPAPLPAELETPLARLLAARLALQARETTAAVEQLQGLIGLGRGLTPSGDDCLAGLLLMRCRAGRAQPGADTMAEALVEAAYERTTAISANILEAAAAGQADERLLQACGAILAGQEGRLPQALNGLLDYGSSSGLDSMVGMVVLSFY